MAVNIERRLPLERWISFWKDTGAGEVLWGQDFEGTTIRDYELLALGTEIIVDREGWWRFAVTGPRATKGCGPRYRKYCKREVAIEWME